MLTHLKNHLVAYVALFLVLGTGSAYANHLQVFSSDIVDGQVNSVDVRDNGLTGTDMAENTLSVPGMGCQNGKIKGYARIKGTNLPASVTYTTSPSWIDATNNCSNGAVQVRKRSTGIYYVKFLGNASAMAIATSNSDGTSPESRHNDNIISVAKVTDGGSADLGAFRVEVQDVNQFASSGSDPEDGQFTILVM
jgi:hypothetical protein